MIAKIICTTLMFLASTSSVFAGTRFAETRKSMITGHVAKAPQAASAMPTVERRQSFIKRRLRITC